MSNKYVGIGFTLKINSTTVAGIRGMSHSEAACTPVDITVWDDLSTSDHYMRKAGGMVDPGFLTLNLAYDPADAVHKTLATMLASGSTGTFVVIYPTTTILETFAGFVGAIGREMPFGELVTATVRIDKSGVAGFST
jgi:hypothetical protein